MTVYELIKELTNYEADMEVEVSVFAKGFETDVTAKEEAECGGTITAVVDLNEEVRTFYVDEKKKHNGKHVVKVNVII